MDYVESMGSPWKPVGDYKVQARVLTRIDFRWSGSARNQHHVMCGRVEKKYEKLESKLRQVAVDQGRPKRT
jgi:hypothetical protein